MSGMDGIIAVNYVAVIFMYLMNKCDKPLMNKCDKPLMNKV